MAKLTDEELDAILKEKFGSFLDWRAPQIDPTIGPHNPEIFENFEEQRQALVTRCIEALRTFSRETVDLILEHPRDDPGGLLKDWHDFLTVEIRFLKKRTPPWYAAGFGHPDYAADFEYWSKMPSLSVEEALCLSVGVEPRHFQKNEIQALQREEFHKLWPSLQFLLRRYEMFRRRFDSHGLDWRVRPKEFLIWSGQVELDVPPELLRLLDKNQASDAKQATSAGTTQRTDPREIDSISQLFTAMAIREYGYVPGNARSPVPREITELAASMGLNVSDDTVRKYLKHGATFLPKGWEPDNP